MTLTLPSRLHEQIKAHLRAAYPNEGAGLLLGWATGAAKQVGMILIFENKFAADEQHHRYLITADDMLAGELTAAEHEMDVVGIFHSHPDHPAEPSEYDREYALPWYSYLIVTVEKGRPTTSRTWLLADDRSHFKEEEFNILPSTGQLRA